MPSNTVIDVYNQLIGPEHKVIRGSIGISFQPSISPTVAKMYGAADGVLINAVTPGEPADKAGLKANDVIISVDGKPIKTGDDLVENITPRHPGSTVSIGYLRNGQKMTATVGIVNRDEIANAQTGNSTPNGPNAAPESNAAQTKLGLTVTDLPQNAPTKLHGVLIRAVKPGSFADELNPSIGPGLVIEAINRKPVHSKAEFDSLVSNLKSGDDVVLEITDPRGTGSSLVGGTLP
jgi:serine protease Do